MQSRSEQRWAALKARNLSLPGVESPGSLDQPLRPNTPQKPCDFGLFGDGPAQTDLVDFINVTARK